MKQTLVFAILLFSVIFIQQADGATKSVPNDYPTIQAAIDAAVNGDTIVLADGIYTVRGIKISIF